MPDFVISTIFKSRDQISGTFAKMSRSAGIFGDKSSKAFRRAGKAGSGFGNILKGILAAGFIQRGITMLTNGLREVGDQFIGLDQSITSASSKFSDLDLSTKEGQKSLEELKKAARTTGALTEKTAAEAAGGLEFWALAGVNAAQAMALLPGSVNLATIAERDLARSSDIASDSLGAFGLMTKDTAQLEKNFTRLLDVMSKTMTSANTDIEAMFETTKKGGATFTAAGQSLETFNAIAGILANNAVKGSEAGTIMRNMMLRLADPSKEAAGIINNLGITIKDSQGNFRDVIDIMANFEKATAKMGTAEKTAALSTIFGARAITGINILLKEGTDKIRDFRDELLNAGGTSEKMAALMRQSLQNRLAALQSAAIEVGFQFVESFEKFGGDAIGKFTEFIRAIPMREIMENIARLGKPIMMVVDAIMSLGSAIFDVLNVAFSTLTFNTGKNIDIIGTLGEVFEFISGVIKSFAAGIKFLSPVLGPIVAVIGAWTIAQWALNIALSANPIGIIIIALTALIAAIGWVVTNWENLTAGIKKTVGKIGAWFEKFLDNEFFTGIKDFFTSIPDKIVQGWEKVKKFFTDFYNNILKPIGDFFINFGKKIEEFVGGAAKGIGDIFTGAFELGKDIGEAIVGKEEPPTPERIAPNETELKVKSSLEVTGKVEFTGAPEGTTASFGVTGAPDIPVEGLGPNR